MGSNAKTIIAPILCLSMVLLAGSCASTKKSEQEETDAEFAESVREVEKDFEPSDYDPPVEPFFRHDVSPKNEISDTVAVDTDAEPAEQTQGFRVQIYSSSSIDSAKAIKATGERDFPGELFYLVYDPPKYKVRAGNFPSRFEADRFVRQLTERGYRDSWVVPDRILKNPPQH